MTKISEVSCNSSFGAEESEESRVRKFSKHMLKSSLFIGTFLEKRFVESLNAYRDIIKVADDETDLIENLRVVRKRCCRYFRSSVWVGITEPTTIGAPAGYNLWVILDQDVLGSYWYKIKTVEFYDTEVRVRLEVVRPVVREGTPVCNISAQEVLENVTNPDMKALRNSLMKFMKTQLSGLFTETLTWTNIKEATIFLFLLISTLLTFLVQGIHYLLDYFLKLLHETQGFIKVSTPIILGCIKLIMNSINGLYALIAFLFRDSRRPPPPQTVYQIHQVPYPERRALPYENEYFSTYRRSPRSSVKITPLD